MCIIQWFILLRAFHVWWTCRSQGPPVALLTLCQWCGSGMSRVTSKLQHAWASWILKIHFFCMIPKALSFHLEFGAEVNWWIVHQIEIAVKKLEVLLSKSLMNLQDPGYDPGLGVGEYVLDWALVSTHPFFFCIIYNIVIYKQASN